MSRLNLFCKLSFACGIVLLVGVIVFSIHPAQVIATPQKNILSVHPINLNQEIKLDGHKYHVIKVVTRFSSEHIEEQIDVQILHDIDCLKKDLAKK